MVGVVLSRTGQIDEQWSQVNCNVHCSVKFLANPGNAKVSMAEHTEHFCSHFSCAMLPSPQRKLQLTADADKCSNKISLFWTTWGH